MKLPRAKRIEAKRRIAAAFGNRRHVAMNTAGQIGQSNFYGDDSMPKLTRTEVLALIDCAIFNWSRDDAEDENEWMDGIVTDIINDIK